MSSGPEAGPAEKVVVARYGREVLNYFGRCGNCGYPAQAFEMTTEFIDGDRRTVVIETCGQPCGWTRQG
ncbi:hypothetical protein NONO_c51780 [Nocardia nova SH22a]|uniref:Uncharacterized protein n=1 Tax=Nocardia nova SH22a TaxID=1415166 RepID=W5TL26_9NOCA|nr:hypothetical protein NONO_c51780 [Nocardia nova SH22a]